MSHLQTYVQILFDQIWYWS